VGKGGKYVSKHFVFMENSLRYLCHCEYVLEQTTFINLICLKLSLGHMPRVSRMIQLVCCLLNRLWVGWQETLCLNSGTTRILLVTTASKPGLKPPSCRFKGYWGLRQRCKWNFGFMCTSGLKKTIYEGWNFNSGNYLFTTDTK